MKAPVAGSEAARLLARREAPARVVGAVFRLIKACLLYTDSNQTVLSLVPPVLDAVEQMCELRDVESVRILFSGDVVFVNRRILRVGRDAYGLALQIGAFIGVCEANELVLERGVTADSVARFARLVADAQRDRALGPRVRQQELPRISLRSAVGPEADQAQEGAGTGLASAVRTYAAAVLLLDASGDEGRRASQTLKRIATKLVAVAEDWERVLVALAASPILGKRDAHRRLAAAVIALGMARRLTTDRATLTSITAAGLLATAYAPEAGGAASPLGALCDLTEAGGASPSALRRTVITVHALRLTAAGTAPASLDSLPLGARLLAVALRFTDLRARPGDAGQSIDAAMREVSASSADPVALSLLAAALGLAPPRTAVKLSTGELAVTTGYPRLHIDYARPRVRILSDAQNEPLPEALERDLARPLRGEPLRAVTLVFGRLTAGGADEAVR